MGRFDVGRGRLSSLVGFESAVSAKAAKAETTAIPKPCLDGKGNFQCRIN
jgi:hypothetical protein